MTVRLSVSHGTNWKLTNKRTKKKADELEKFDKCYIVISDVVQRIPAVYRCCEKTL